MSSRTAAGRERSVRRRHWPPRCPPRRPAPGAARAQWARWAGPALLNPLAGWR